MVFERRDRFLHRCNFIAATPDARFKSGVKFIHSRPKFFGIFGSGGDTQREGAHILFGSHGEPSYTAFRTNVQGKSPETTIAGRVFPAAHGAEPDLECALMSAQRPCLRIVSVEPPVMECSDCGIDFEVKSDSLREVLIPRTHSGSTSMTRSHRSANSGMNKFLIYG
jgi:hypothetical protein